MTSPPPQSFDPRLLLSSLASLGRDLRGAASPGDMLELLQAYAWAVFSPDASFTAWRSAPDTAIVARCRAPEPIPGPALLTLAARTGPALLTESLPDELEQAERTLPFVDNTAPGWLLVPLVTGAPGCGSLAIRRSSKPFTDADLAVAQGLAAAVGIALEALSLRNGDSLAPTWQDGLDGISRALCLIDTDGSIRRANRAFAWLVTTPPNALIGRPWRSLVPADWVSDLDRVINSPGSGSEVELRRENRIYAVTAAPAGGAPHPGVVLLFDDQTERHLLFEQLLHSEKMSAIGQLIAGVAHDLNNPLASVVGFAEFLAERPEVPAALREPVTIIRDEAERASGIVRNLLSFARKQEHQRRPTPMKPLLDATLGLLRNELMSSRVEARLDMEPDVPTPIIDPNQIQQVFVNLIHNAAQAITSTGRPGTIVVRARRRTDGLAVDVIDDGPGMSESVAARVFDPFFTTKPEGKGTGLGLSISQGIVSQHNGQITLETAEGRGSTFTVLLPIGEVEPPAAAEGPRPAATRLRILVVDDEPHILHYMRATLESWGHSVAEAVDGEEARARLAEASFDLIIADLRMPRLGGREFYEELRRTRPAQAEQVVFATGDTVRGDTLAFLTSVGRPYLHKPFSLSELRTLLAGVSKASDG